MLKKTFAASLAALLLVFGFQLADSASAAPVNGGAWCADLAAGDPRVDVLGDSIMNADIVAQGDRWHDLLDASLRSDGAPNAEMWTGGAINGSATADYTTGAPYSGHIEFTANRPSLVLMNWGTNDWAGGVSVATYRTNYQQIITRIRQLAPDATITLITSPWTYNYAITSTRPAQQPYAAAARELADANGLPTIRTEWGFPGNKLDRYAPDQVHPNELGQWFEFSMIRSALLAHCGRS